MCTLAQSKIILKIKSNQIKSIKQFCFVFSSSPSTEMASKSAPANQIKGGDAPAEVLLSYCTLLPPLSLHRECIHRLARFNVIMWAKQVVVSEEEKRRIRNQKKKENKKKAKARGKEAAAAGSAKVVQPPQPQQQQTKKPAAPAAAAAATKAKSSEAQPPAQKKGLKRRGDAVEVRARPTSFE